MIKSLLASAALLLGLVVSANATNVDVPPMGNTHLHIGGGANRIIGSTNATSTNALDGKLTSTFILSTTNISVSLYATNFIDGQQAQVFVTNAGTSNAVVQFSDSGRTYSAPTNYTSAYVLTYVDGSYHSKLSIGLGDNVAVNTLSATNGIYIPTNGVVFWPAQPRFKGDIYLGNSNGVLHALTSISSATAWTATNRLAP